MCYSKDAKPLGRPESLGLPLMEVAWCASSVREKGQSVSYVLAQLVRNLRKY